MLKITRESSFSVIHFISNLRYTVLPQHAAFFPSACLVILDWTFPSSKRSPRDTDMPGGFFTTTTKMAIPECHNWFLFQTVSPYSTAIHERRPAETLDLFESTAPVRIVWCAPKESRYGYTVTHSVHTRDTLMLSVWASFQLAPSSANKYSDILLLKPSQFQYFLFIYLYVNSALFSWWYPTVLCIGTLFHETQEWN